MTSNEKGREGEDKARRLLKKLGYTEIFQPDWVFLSNKWTLLEVKNQDIFLPPPFYGHGLPLYQVIRYLRFQKDTGLRCILMVFDENAIYWQYLDVLHSREKYITHTKSRCVYPLYNFIEIHAQKNKEIETEIELF